jgi:phospholipase/carboxylesterase
MPFLSVIVPSRPVQASRFDIAGTRCHCFSKYVVILAMLLCTRPLQVLADPGRMTSMTIAADSALPPFVEHRPATAPRACVIWLHGLGADGHDFEPIVPELGIVDAEGVWFLFPHAPHRAVTLNNGYVMRAWFDLYDLDRSHAEDSDGIRQSGELVSALIDHVRAQGVPAQRIVLAGFSQGGAIALYAGLRYPERLAGILALSTYLPLPGMLATERQVANADVPIMMAHGAHDDVIAPVLAEHSRDQLQHLGYAVEWHRYDMAHAVTAREIDDIAAWLRAVLAL